MPVQAIPTSELRGTAEHVLASWTAAADAGTAGPDLGPAVLATLLPDSAVTRAATNAWLRAGTRCPASPALHGGTSGIVAGLRLIAGRNPSAGPAAERAAVALARTPPRWRSAAVGFTDYDVVGGPAGMVLAHLTGTRQVQPALLRPPVAQLVALAGGPTGFRIGAHAGHPLAGWAQDGVVTGLAHGVAGPLAALSAAAPHLAADLSVLPAIDRLATWLAAERFTDAHGITCWPRRLPATDPVDRAGPVRRQGWCYGTPGVAWALWTAGRALLHSGHNGEHCRQLAMSAMRTLCAGYDPRHHLDHDPLAVCHGAAGVLLVADAFARHAHLAPAAALREDLTRYLVDRLDQVRNLDADLLTGATGVLAALLTARGGDRGWLPSLALQ